VLHLVQLKKPEASVADLNETCILYYEKKIGKIRKIRRKKYYKDKRSMDD
jgi:hypothetical protein